MRELWLRLRRLWRESEIRLEQAGISPQAIHPGDRLQTGSRVWRVERRLTGGGFELAAEENGRLSRTRLRFEGSDVLRPWIFEDEDAAVRLASADLLHFPVALTHSMSRG